MIGSLQWCVLRWSGLLPPVPSWRWLGFISAVPPHRSCENRASKEVAARVPHSFGVLCVGFDTPGTAGFLKAAVQNQHPRVGTGAPRLCLFYFVAHHYLTERERLELHLTCIDERPLCFPRTQSAVCPAQHKHQIYMANFFSLSSIPFPPLQLLSISHISPFRNTLY